MPHDLAWFSSIAAVDTYPGPLEHSPVLTFENTCVFPFTSIAMPLTFHKHKRAGLFQEVYCHFFKNLQPKKHKVGLNTVLTDVP